MSIPPKRSHIQEGCPQCLTCALPMNLSYCPSTGLLHGSLCSVCGLKLHIYAFCAANGQPHSMITATKPLHSPLLAITHTKTEPLGFAAIRNRGNSCYAISALQFLYSAPDFAEHMIADASLMVNKRQKAVRLQQHLALMFLRMRLTHLHVLPLNILAHFPAPYNNNVRQHDASEFIYALIHATENSKFFEIGECWTVKCDFCQHTSINYGIACMLDVQLPYSTIPQPLEALFAALLASTELLRGENRYDCPMCAEKTNASRKFTLTYLPAALLLTLKRFIYDPVQQRTIKNASHVSVSTTLTVATATGHRTYKLSAIVAHIGNCDAGHYIVFTFSPCGNFFRIFDDAIFSDLLSIGLMDAVRPDAVPYIVLYTAGRGTQKTRPNYAVQQWITQLDDGTF